MTLTLILVVLLLLIAVVLHVDAPRQARALAARTPQHLSPPTERGRSALHRELTSRLRLTAVGSALGTTMVGVPLVAQEVDAQGPAGLTMVATLLTSTVVVAVATEAASVLRRTPRAAGGVRAATLKPRESHTGTGERVAELVLWLLATAALALGVGAVANGVDGAAGAVGCGVGALVVIAACTLVRARFVRRPVLARDVDDLAVDAAAGRATVERFSENLVASGGVLTLAALLVPAVSWPGAARTTAVVLGFVTVVVMTGLVLLRRVRREQVHA
jgi:hypothetical protein